MAETEYSVEFGRTGEIFIWDNIDPDGGGEIKPSFMTIVDPDVNEGEVLVAGVGGTTADWSTPAGGGLGDVVGPASATDEAFARFDTTTGKLLQNSVVKATNAGAMTGITDLTVSGAIMLTGVNGQDLLRQSSNPGNRNFVTVYNTDNTDPASHAVLRAWVGGANGGDPYVEFLVQGAQSWVAGIDNSDTNAFKIDKGPTVGADTKLKINLAGDVTLFADLTVDTNTLFVDSSNGRIGVGTLTPGELITAVDNQDALTAIRLINTHTGTSARTLFSVASGSVRASIQSVQSNNTVVPAWSDSSVFASDHDMFVGPSAAKNLYLQTGGVGTKRMTILSNGLVSVGAAVPTILFDVNAKSGFTSIGGHVIKLTNKTGFASIVGRLVEVYSATAVDDAFKSSAANSDGVIGIVYESGVADGSEVWIVVSGIADVLINASGCARGDRLISSGVPGSAGVWNVGGAVATHFQEIGHCLESRVGAGLARVVLHFN